MRINSINCSVKPTVSEASVDPNNIMKNMGSALGGNVFSQQQKYDRALQQQAARKDIDSRKLVKQVQQNIVSSVSALKSNPAELRQFLNELRTILNADISNLIKSVDSISKQQ